MRNSLELIKVGGECLNALAKDGCEVEIISDFVQAEEMVGQMGKINVTAKLSGRFNDFTEKSGFWLFMKKQGECVSAVATRLDDVGRESMGDYMVRTMRRHYPNESGRTLLDFTGALPPRFLGKWPILGNCSCVPKSVDR